MQDVIKMSVSDTTILSCFNEKIQIKNVKMKTLYFSNCDRHKPNNFVMAALSSSHKLHGFCIEVKVKSDVLVVGRRKLLSYTLLYFP